MTEKQFLSETTKLGISIDSRCLKKLNEYKLLLQEWNDKFNLTTIIKDEEIYLKHFYDSLVILSKEKISGNVCDFGTGAGFPGLVLAIVLDNCSFDLIESNLKKCTFLKNVISKLGLRNVNIINSRMEDYAKKSTEKYNYILCRAVSNLGIISELAIRSLKINGYFIPFKTNSKIEYEEYKHNINKLGFRLVNIYYYKLPFENSERSLIILKKEKKTIDKYPRNYNVIKKENKNVVV